MSQSQAKAQNLILPDANNTPVTNLKTRPKVLIADADTVFARRLADGLTAFGVDARTATSITEAKAMVEFWRPNTVFVDLLLPATNALSLFRFVRTKQLLRPPKMIVMAKSAYQQSIEQMRRAGAAHYLLKPFAIRDALKAAQLESLIPFKATNRVSQLPPPQVVLQNQISSANAATVKELHLLNLFLKQAIEGCVKGDTGFYNLMRMISIKVKAARCSLIHCMNAETGVVLASNDNENIQGLPIDLKKYPELRSVMLNRDKLIIPDVYASPILAPVHNEILQTPFVTLVLFPVFRGNTPFGVMSLRMERKDAVELPYIEKFGQVCSQVISLTLANPALSRL